MLKEFPLQLDNRDLSYSYSSARQLPTTLDFPTLPREFSPEWRVLPENELVARLILEANNAGEFTQSHEQIVNKLWTGFLQENPENFSGRFITSIHALSVGIIADLSLHKYWAEINIVDRRRFLARNLLHDIGKGNKEFEQPDHLIHQYESTFTDRDRETMKKHTLYGAKILEKSNLPSDFALIANFHHERLDGQGNNRLKGSEIPVSALYTALADSTEAILSSQRRYSGNDNEDATKLLTTKLGPIIDTFYHPMLQETYDEILTLLSDGILEKLQDRVIRTTNRYDRNKIVNASVTPNIIDLGLEISNEILYYSLAYHYWFSNSKIEASTVL